MVTLLTNFILCWFFYRVSLFYTWLFPGLKYCILLSNFLSLSSSSKVSCFGLSTWLSVYSLFTLFMLFMFESTMAKSRLKTLTELRRVRVDSQILMVHRCGKWVKLSGTDLLPGDVVSIGRSSGQNGEEKSVPADMLILVGSAIVNEAILTGESTPQWKAGIGMFHLSSGFNQ
ncbi:hypothetical protein RIF29_25356 [Crotalaria pallida]|uniref:P-type ATPase A domain-containing protein n=1 Tax=Crotalaria pallida TaxID=3830 RepID=A0AAN9ETM3_CROPI